MSFVVLIIGNSKSVHLGAQSTFNGPFLFSIRSPQRRAAGRAAHRYSHDSHHTRWAVFSGKGGWGPGAEGVPAIPAGGRGKQGGAPGAEGVPAIPGRVAVFSAEFLFLSFSCGLTQAVFHPRFP